MTKRGGSARFLDALRALQDALDDTGKPWMFIGGVAVIAQGIDRLTADIDATIMAAGSTPESLLRALARHAIVARIRGAAAFARRTHVLLLRHKPSGVDLDVSLGMLRFEEDAIAAAQLKRFAGEKIRVAAPDDLIVFKLVAGRPQDVDDATKLLDLYRDRVDEKRVEAILDEFSSLLENPVPSTLLRQLLASARPRRKKR